MVDIQSATVEIRRGKKKKEDRKKQDKNIMSASATQSGHNETKVMISGESCKGVHNSGRWPCGVCGRAVGRNSVQHASCQKWVHEKCSGIN